MTEEDCRRDDEMMRERRRRQKERSKELTFIEWISEHLKEEKSNDENCD